MLTRYSAPLYRHWGKVQCTPVQALRLCTGRTAHSGSRGIALHFHDKGTRRGWGVSVTHRPLFTPKKDLVPIVQEAGWAPWPVWTGVENLDSTEIRSLDRPVLSTWPLLKIYSLLLLFLWHYNCAFLLRDQTINVLYTRRFGPWLSHYINLLFNRRLFSESCFLTDRLLCSNHKGSEVQWNLDY